MHVGLIRATESPYGIFFLVRPRRRRTAVASMMALPRSDKISAVTEPIYQSAVPYARIANPKSALPTIYIKLLSCEFLGER